MQCPAGGEGPTGKKGGKRMGTKGPKLRCLVNNAMDTQLPKTAQRECMTLACELWNPTLCDSVRRGKTLRVLVGGRVRC